MLIERKTVEEARVGTTIGRRALAALCMVLLGAAGGAREAAAGPLDARAARCAVNNGGTAPSGTAYEGYRGYGFLIPAGRSTLAVPSQPTQGQVLFSVEEPMRMFSGGAQGRVSPLYGCPPGTIETFQSASALVPGTSDIYRTNFPGIGFRIYYYIANDTAMTAPVSFVNTHTRGALVFPFDSPMTPGARARIEVVATGEPIGTGTLNTGNTISAYTTVTGPGAIPAAGLYNVSMYGSVTLVLPTCGVINLGALNISLPDATLSALKSGNADAVTSTTLQVSCGSESHLAPALSISGTTVSGYPATLVNQDTTASGAKGVGVRLWVYDPQADAFRQPTMGLKDGTLGLPVGTLPTRQWSYQVGASYLQVAPTPTAGAVRATAVLTFTYS